ncbi:hypothetical protein PRBEI_2000325800 [Prionailurus iriomotensis]
MFNIQNERPAMGKPFKGSLYSGLQKNMLMTLLASYKLDNTKTRPGKRPQRKCPSDHIPSRVLNRHQVMIDHHH